MEPDDALLLSGIQHFAFCKRQWALIHLESQWQENARTVKGAIVHERAHDDTLTEKRGDLLITRGLRVASSRLGAVGQLDVVEFHRSERWAQEISQRVAGEEAGNDHASVSGRKDLVGARPLCAVHSPCQDHPGRHLRISGLPVEMNLGKVSGRHARAHHV